MNKTFQIITSILIFITGCTSIIYVNKNAIKEIIGKNAVEWNLDECNKILDFYSTNNLTNKIFKSGPINPDVYIKAFPLNRQTIQAMSRKEVLEKRLDNKDYYNILNSYLSEFTSLIYDDKSNRIIEADSNFTKGYSFKVYFENISDPYRPIFLEDGYSYFFLENLNQEFSRITAVVGLFVEDYFQLDGYLDAVITFSPFSNNSNQLFNTKDINESYKLVFNGLQKEPIVLQWILK